MADMSGKAVAITGASSWIGEATALALARAGASVALGARRSDRIEALARRIEEETGSTAVALEVDVTDEAQARAFVADAAERLGRLDTLVNNAGVMLLGPIADAPVEEWQRMVHVNLLGLLYCAQAALPHLVSAAGTSPRRVADMINVSSVAGRVARSGSGVYNATKFGVGAFSEALRQEVTQKHVRISLVEPGATDTELRSHNRPEVQEAIMARFTGVERLQAADIADAIRYIVTRPRHVAVNEMLVRPTEQAG